MSLFGLEKASPHGGYAKGIDGLYGLVLEEMSLAPRLGLPTDTDNMAKAVKKPNGNDAHEQIVHVFFCSRNVNDVYL
jgi:hypothetical protein